MTLKRAQGRPTRGVDDVGRERLLEGARVVFRSKATFPISRQDIARAAGVTPALVSYYFADKASLVLAAAQPIIETYARDAVAVLDREAPYLERLEELVVLFLRFAATEGGVLDIYLAHGHAFASNPVATLMPDLWERLTAFLAAGVEANAWRRVDPALLLFFIWGICKVVAHSPPIPLHILDDDLSGDGPRQRQARLIVELLRDGIHPAQN